MNNLKSLIKVNELQSMINNIKNNLKIFDCTVPIQWGYPEFTRKHIKTAQYMNIFNLRNKESQNKLEIPSKNDMIDFCEEYDIAIDDHIVFYDQRGILTSPRAWFIFHAYNFKNLSILDGGFVKWTLENAETESGEPIKQYTNKELNIENIELDKSLLIEYNDIKQLNNSKENKSVIIDTRLDYAFNKGHIPNTVSFPFDKFINNDGTLKEKNEIIEILNKNNINYTEDNLISSCNTGLTACVANFAFLNKLGIEKTKLYNGSYEEYLRLSNNKL